MLVAFVVDVAVDRGAAATVAAAPRFAPLVLLAAAVTPRVALRTVALTASAAALNARATLLVLLFMYTTVGFNGPREGSGGGAVSTIIGDRV